MKNLVLPLTRTQEVFKVESSQGITLFNTMNVVGNSEHTSLRPHQWAHINNIDEPSITSYSKGRGALFVDIHRLEHDKSLIRYKDALIETAHQCGFLEASRYHVVEWRDGDVHLGSTFHRDYNDALEAASGNESIVKTHSGLIGTLELASKVGVSEEFVLRNATTYGLIGALQHLSEGGLNIDGIFWSEEYEAKDNMTEILSIFPSKVNQWTQSPSNMPLNDGELFHTKTPTSHQLMSIGAKEKRPSVTLSM